MLKHVDGKLIPVPDDARITPEFVALRTGINAMLSAMTADTPENRRLREQYRTGRMAETDGFDWFADPLEPSPVGRASAPDACGAAPLLAFRSENADTAEHAHE